MNYKDKKFLQDNKISLIFCIFIVAESAPETLLLAVHSSSQIH